MSQVVEESNKATAEKEKCPYPPYIKCKDGGEEPNLNRCCTCVVYLNRPR